MEPFEQIQALVKPIREDLQSGAAEIALRAITVFQTILASQELKNQEDLKAALNLVVKTLLDAQPAMAPVFHLCNTVLLAISQSNNQDQTRTDCQAALEDFERTLCESAAAIAEKMYELIPPGELIFAYSFSSTVVSSLLNARARGRYFRVACTESRPSLEGQKLAKQLASGNVEVIYTFDSAMTLVLPNCSVAFMGCDCVGMPGVVNKVGSYLLALACRELNIPLYVLAGSEKIVSDDRLFEFERHERPGEELWASIPKGVRVLNHQFELVPLSLLSGIVTEKGILNESGIEKHVNKTKVHDSLILEPISF
jgi:translation initiation factor 2B subunit (eIF-2B alpha/beta/delta family)